MSITQLTDRELDVVACLLNGRSIKKTALLLKISPKTVETYLRNLMLKLQCNSRDHLIDIIITENKLEAIHQQYGKIIGQDYKNNKNIIPPLKKKNISKLILYISTIVFILLFVLKNYWLPSSPSRLREELRLPSSFLERPTLLKEIKSKFSTNHPLQIIIIMGAGGAGKTTLAYHYANQYNEGPICLVHANTKENILLSFEKFVFAIMHQQKDSVGIQELRKAQETPQYEKIFGADT